MPFGYKRARTSEDIRLREWLKSFASARGDRAEALALAEVLFWARPSVTVYKEVKELAGESKSWETMRRKLLARLAKEGQHALLTEIHLDDGDVDRALETLKRVKNARWGWECDPLSLKVARGSEELRPREAIALY